MLMLRLSYILINIKDRLICTNTDLKISSKKKKNRFKDEAYFYFVASIDILEEIQFFYIIICETMMVNLLYDSSKRK